MIALLAVLAAAGAAGTADGVRLPVPIVRQAPERCGPAALSMVLLAYGADSAAARAPERTYDPALRGALVTDLAACARRLGYGARVAAPGIDSLAPLLRSGVPPILLVSRGLGPVARGHYLVVTGCDARAQHYRVHDGSPVAHDVPRTALLRAWRASGGQALIVWKEP